MTKEGALKQVDAYWTAKFPYGPDEPDAYKHLTPGEINAWRSVRKALTSKDG